MTTPNLTVAAELRAGTASRAGRSRAGNEDRVLTVGRLFAVADGMGGHAAGEAASAIAVDRLALLGAREEDLTADDVRAALALANQDILDSVVRSPERFGMGTTAAGLCLVPFAGSEHWIVFNVGDSRVYRFAQDVLVQLTVDHTEVAELLASGRIDAEGARRHPRRNVITRALGSDPAPEADVWVFPPVSGERFVICSDGLTLELAEAEISDILRAEPSASDAADALVRRAVEAGGRDDVSVVVVDRLTDAVTASSVDENTLPRPVRADALS